jgi:hypothetical protein
MKYGFAWIRRLMLVLMNNVIENTTPAQKQMEMQE